MDSTYQPASLPGKGTIEFVGGGSEGRILRRYEKRRRERKWLTHAVQVLKGIKARKKDSTNYFAV